MFSVNGRGPHAPQRTSMGGIINPASYGLLREIDKPQDRETIAKDCLCLQEEKAMSQKRLQIKGPGGRVHKNVH